MSRVWRLLLQVGKKLWPDRWVRRPHLNFITIHYMYIIGWALVGSILVYPAGGISYTDSLFLASGSTTQSGLNTINLNDITFYQQFALFMVPMFASPIFINTLVVFVRLYWFERRFQHIVRDARTYRRTRSRSRTETKDDRDLENGHRGVNGRNIVVLRHTGQAFSGEDALGDSEFHENGMIPQGDAAFDEKENDEAPNQQGNGHISVSKEFPSFRRDIMFADEMNKEDEEDPDPNPRLPEPRSTEQHIAFLENQRNPKDKGALRIPGPREFDRGDVPRTVEEDDEDDIRSTTRRNTMPSSDQVSDRKGSLDVSGLSPDGAKVKRTITIDEPPRPRTRPAGTHLTASGTLDRNMSRQHTTETIGSGLRNRARTFTSMSLKPSRSVPKDPMPYLSWQPTIGRNSAFVDLTQEQREELGGIEYRALKTLAAILVVYYLGFHLLGLICMLPWILRTQPYSSIVEQDGVGRVWWAFFTSSSAFNDLGFTLTPDSMMSFQNAVFPLILFSFLIVIGNTGFPCMLRFVIWLLSKLVNQESGLWEELQFLLDHPRRCFTLLFPSKATWVLFFILVALNGVDLIFFIILDLKDPTVTTLAPGFRFLDGLFQAFSTRTAGFSVVNLANLHPAIQVSYLIMMYISVFPIAISVRRTNVYEEKSLGIYGSPSEDQEDVAEPSYVGAHLRRQLSFDLWYIFLGLFIIAIVEGSRLDNTDINFTLFTCLFEIVSAYGTVGLSLGYPGVDTSFSGQFSVLSKLVIIAMQIRGRHRGLPYELDRAILLPSEHLHQKEEEDARRRMQRRQSMASFTSGQTNPSGLPRAATNASRQSN